MFRAFSLILTAILVCCQFGNQSAAQPKDKALKMLAAKGWGTLKGTVTYDGDPPPLKDLRKIIAGNKEWNFFKTSPEKDLLDPTWVINKKNKGVANVVVWLKPPAGTFFKIPLNDKNRTDTVVLDRPFCAYRPHVLTLFPRYFDGSKWHKTGQVFKLVNSAPINHCPRLVADGVTNRNWILILKPKSEKVLELYPQETPIPCSCTFYNWLSAYIWVFDHPYSAVTNEDGQFVIPRVPAGAEVRVMAWHEDLGYVLGGKDGKKIAFENEVKQMNFQIKK